MVVKTRIAAVVRMILGNDEEDERKNDSTILTDDYILYHMVVGL